MAMRKFGVVDAGAISVRGGASAEVATEIGVTARDMQLFDTRALRGRQRIMLAQ